MHPLDGIRAKLDRAEEHLNALNDEITSYFEKHPYRVVGEEEMRGSQWHFTAYLEVARFPPDRVWGPIIGDVVHNLRSAP